MNDKLEAFLADVEKINGLPVVLSRFGFKKEVFNGKTYLFAMTKEELVMRLRRTGKLGEHDTLDDPRCFTPFTLLCQTGGSCDHPCSSDFGTDSMACICK